MEDPILLHLLQRKYIIRLRRKTFIGIPWGDEILSPWTRLFFARAQLKVEGLHFRQRQQLMEYEDWLNKVYYQMGAGE